MSAISRFMHTARIILDQQDRVAPNPHQPPVFVRTNWLFVELDEAMAEIAKLAHAVKVARLNNDVARAALLNAEMLRKLRQATQICVWADEQFEREGV